MGGDLIQAKYEALESIAVRFGSESERVNEVNGRIQQAIHALQNGGWDGQGSQAFFTEMENHINPAAVRLIDALEQARIVTLELKQLIQEAEEEAARPFGGEGGSDNVVAGGALGGAMGWGGTAGSPVAQSSNPIGKNGLFSHSYMDKMVGRQIRGAGDPQLIDAMRTLSGNPTPDDANEALDKIAAARGMTREKIQADYNRYLQLRTEADRIGAAKGKDAWEPLNETLHPNFMGSTVQLRNGQVVGDALGIDATFGSLLSPSGGLVGPGNRSVQFSTEAPVGYHGVFHDAAGYLKNYHNLGPGYDYMGLEPNRDTTDPFTGQETGIAYWNNKMGAGPFDTTVSNGFGTILGEVVDIKRGFGEAVDSAKDMVDDIQDGFSDFIEWVF